MGYNIEISVNMLKETNFFEIERNIQDTANFYSCNSLHVSSEEDGTKKIPRYHCIFVVNFLDENFDNFIKFIKVLIDICVTTYFFTGMVVTPIRYKRLTAIQEFIW